MNDILNQVAVLAAHASLPDRVTLELAADPRFANLLSKNSHLGPETWERLVDQEDRSVRKTQGPQTEYLMNNVDRHRANRLVARIGDLGLTPSRRNDYLRSDLDRVIAKVFASVVVTTEEAQSAIDQRLPLAALACLRQTHLPIELRKDLAATTYRAETLAFLATPEADVFSDDEVWNMAASPSRIETAARTSSFGDRLAVTDSRSAAELLYARPALVDRAIWSSSALWLLAASSVPLDAAQQFAVLGEFETVWPREREWVRQFHQQGASSLSVEVVDPVLNIVATPWCTQEFLEFVLGNDSRFTLEGKVVFFTPPGYTYSRSVVRSDTETLDLATASPEAAEAWLDKGSSSLTSWPFVVLSAAPNRSLGSRVSLRRRDALNGVAHRVPSAVKRLKRLKVKDQSSDRLNYYWNEPEVTEAVSDERLEEHSPGVLRLRDLLVSAGDEVVTVLRAIDEGKSLEEAAALL